ncbi:MAG: beta-ketoacyl-[acyl-carrier-protein] synthase family protein [Myxococcales bacterium]|nr:beta-ketoacyl-[acyl-carrier-protein] synthase family protein [Myxococcales bacterium]
MGIHTPLGTDLDGFLAALLAGRSAISNWSSVPTDRIWAKVGGDLGEVDVDGLRDQVSVSLPGPVADRLRRLLARAPWSTRISMLTAARAMVHARWTDDGPDLDELAVVVAGHNLNARYLRANHLDFEEDPSFIDGLMSLHGLDTDHAGSVSEVLGARGAIYTVGGACASGNHALRCAVDEVRHHGASAALVVGAALDLSEVDLQGMALMGAITTRSFNDQPTRASRPFDVRREGFVPSHGCGALLLEPLDAALARGATVLAEVVAVEASADANHLPNPSVDGQTKLIRKVLRASGLAPTDIDWVSAHATSTPLGDLTEVRSLRAALGPHAGRVVVNAPKSLLGHTCWSAPVVETVAAVLQMGAGRLHASANVEELDPEIDLDVCADGPRQLTVRHCLKNSFGFGGINAVAVLRHPGEVR